LPFDPGPSGKTGFYSEPSDFAPASLQVSPRPTISIPTSD
jgi:hypothetical protein